MKIRLLTFIILCLSTSLCFGQMNIPVVAIKNSATGPLIIKDFSAYKKENKSPDKYNFLIGGWTDSSGDFGVSFTHFNDKNKSKPLIAKLSHLYFRSWSKNYKGEIHTSQVLQGIEQPNLNFDFWQDNWMQACSYSWTIIAYHDDYLEIEQRTNAGATSPNKSIPCTQIGKVTHYKLYKVVSK